jgi:hypothetical protein
MTAPDYTDKDVVQGMTKTHLKNLAHLYRDAKPSEPHRLLIKGLLGAFLETWEERDKARGTAILQDAGIHGMQKRNWVLEKLLMAVRKAKETGYMPNFVVIDDALADVKRQEEGK